MSVIWAIYYALPYLGKSNNPFIVYSTGIVVKELISIIALSSNTLRILVHGLIRT